MTGARRGPYRKTKKLAIDDNRWRRDDTVLVGAVRWIITQITGNDVVLLSSNTMNHSIRWNTTLDRLPERTPKP